MQTLRTRRSSAGEPTRDANRYRAANLASTWAYEYGGLDRVMYAALTKKKCKRGMWRLING